MTITPLTLLTLCLLSLITHAFSQHNLPHFHPKPILSSFSHTLQTTLYHALNIAPFLFIMLSPLSPLGLLSLGLFGLYLFKTSYSITLSYLKPTPNTPTNPTPYPHPLPLAQLTLLAAYTLQMPNPHTHLPHIAITINSILFLILHHHYTSQQYKKTTHKDDHALSTTTRPKIPHT